MPYENTILKITIKCLVKLQFDKLAIKLKLLSQM